MNKDDEYEAKYRKDVKPCPFCGEPPVIMSSGSHGEGLMIHCIADCCTHPSSSFYEHRLALEVWNRRDPAGT